MTGSQSESDTDFFGQGSCRCIMHRMHSLRFLRTLLLYSFHFLPFPFLSDLYHSWSLIKFHVHKTRSVTKYFFAFNKAKAYRKLSTSNSICQILNQRELSITVSSIPQEDITMQDVFKCRILSHAHNAISTF